MMIAAFLFAILLLSSIKATSGFVPPSVATRQITILHGVVGGDNDDDTNKSSSSSSSNDDDSGNENPSFDVENARQRLENLLEKGENKSDDDNNNNMATTATTFSFSKLLLDYGDGVDFSLSSLPPPPPLSTIERDRRLVEIRLLECLIDGDDALAELWDHWYSERGRTAKSLLEQTDGMFTDPSTWKECEINLLQLVDEYGIYFVEPVNRLATLYYLQGKLEVSYKLCQIIVSIKPYHIGALSGIVQVALGLRDPVAARDWAILRLPSAVPGPDNFNFDDEREEADVQPVSPRRVDWVERAVATAKDLLDQAERRTQEDFFGKPETYYDNEASSSSDYLDDVNSSKNNDVGISNHSNDDNNDEDAWQ